MKLPDPQPDIHLEELFYTQLSSEKALIDLLIKLDSQQEWFTLVGVAAMLRSRFPHNIKGYAFGAKAHRQILEFKVADAICLDGIRRFPERFELYEAYANNAHHQMNWSVAIERWKDMRTRFPDIPAAYFQEAMDYRQMGDYQASNHLMNEVMVRFPQEHYRALVVLAHAAKERFCLEEAFERWLALLKDYPDQVETYTNIVPICLELYSYKPSHKHYLQQARQYLDDAVARFPNHRRVLLCQANFLNHQKT